MRNLGPTQEKILLLLMGGLVLGLTHSPRQYFRMVKLMRTGWKDINRRNVTRSIRRLYQAKLVTEKHHRDGSITLVLTPEGRQRASLFQRQNIRINKPKRWDKLWRIVLFDIPERKRSLRNIFRRHLKKIGFYEFQKSVFVFPYDCEQEMFNLINLYDAQTYIRFIAATHIDNEKELIRHFSLR